MKDGPTQFSRFLTVKEAATFLGVAEATIRNWDRSGKLSAIRHPLNNYRLYDRAELTALLAQVKRASSLLEKDLMALEGSYRNLQQVSPPALTKPASGQAAEEVVIAQKGVVLVEDNARDEALILRAFKKHNYLAPIQVLRDGKAAVDYLASGQEACTSLGQDSPFRLILLDLYLPKLDGFEVLRQLRKNPTTRAVPVVTLTASEDAHNICYSYQLGANGYVVKSLDPQKFNAAVGAVCTFWLTANRPPTENKG